MKIRAKLAWILTAILVLTVTAGSAYAIYYIRAYLLEQAVSDMEKDGYLMMHTLRFFPDGVSMQEELNRVGQATDYHIALYDSQGAVLATYPDSAHRSLHLNLKPEEVNQLLRNQQTLFTINDSDSENIWVYASIQESHNAARFFVIYRIRSQVFAPVKEIRNIIYIGLVVSIVFILFFSGALAQYMARPVLKLTRDVQRIAKGDTEHHIRLKRSDEIGILGDSVNKMAQKLRSDYEHLQKLNEKQRRFFADITHEVRNPLHTIMGSLEMLELPDLNDEKRRKYVKNLQSQANRIGRLFKDLMTLQRYDSDENFVIREHVNMADIAGTVAEWYYETARRKGVEMKIDTHPCMVYADPGKIEQVLDNLVSNAIKFTNEGSVSMTYNDDGNRVEVAITDTGIGIPDTHLPHLFDRFYRTDKARSRDKGGTGLGLSVVKGILKAHGSDIHMESEVGRGSRFYFYLKSSQAVREKQDSGSVASTKATEYSKTGKNS
ncbi:MAG: ATP-binding protein [Balneolales bacterium]